MGLRDRLLGRKSKNPSSSSGAQQALAPPIPNTSKPQIASKINAVYYPNWRVYRQQPPSSLNLRYITHVFYAFAWVKPDGTVYLSDPHADTQHPIPSTNTHGCLPDLLALKHAHPKLRTILSIGGGTNSTAFAAATSSLLALTNLGVTARQLCEQHGFDGVDVDWESPSTAREGAQFLALLSTLRDPGFFPSREGWLITAALAAPWGVRYVDLAAAAGTGLDWLNLMCYDFSGPWTAAQGAGHHARLWSTPPGRGKDAVASAEGSVQFVVGKGVPAGKVVVGCPCYGRVFEGAEGVGDVFREVGEEEGGVLEYRELMRRGVDVQWDARVGAAWCVEGDKWISFDDVRCVKAKGEFVRERGLGGLFFWTGTGDVEDGESEGSLVRAGAVAMRG